MALPAPFQCNSEINATGEEAARLNAGARALWNYRSSNRCLAIERTRGPIDHWRVVSD
jgi:hypothetical protein